MSNKRRNNSFGFSLVEILVVLAIISILSTIVYTSISKQRQRARIATAIASVKSAMTPAMTCVTLGGEVIPPMAGSIGGGELCSGSDEFSDLVIWPALTNGCYYCGTSDDSVLFRCSGACGSGEESFCNYNTTKCVQQN